MDFTFPSPHGARASAAAIRLGAVHRAVRAVADVCAAPRLSPASAAARRQAIRKRSPEAGRRCRASISGSGLGCLLRAQPLLYMALGFSWLFTAFGRLVAIMSGRAANTPLPTEACTHRRSRPCGAAAGRLLRLCRLNFTVAAPERCAGLRQTCPKSAGIAACCGRWMPVLIRHRRVAPGVLPGSCADLKIQLRSRI